MSGISAAAEPEAASVDEAIQAIDAIAGDLRTDAVEVTDVDATVVAGGSVVEFSEDAADGISIAGANGTDIEIGLPFAQAADEGELVDGSLVYDNNNGSTTTPLVHDDDGSVQVLTTISDASAPTSYEYDLQLASDARLVLNADGSVDILSGAGAVLGTIAAPWASDASGAPVPTRYEVEGDSLTQVVDHKGAIYPVVADPKISFGWKIYLKYSKWEVKTLTSGWIGNVTDKAKYTAVLCGAAAEAGWFVVAACGVYVYDVISSVMTTAKKAASKGECLELQYLYNGPLVGWKGYSC